MPFLYPSINSTPKRIRSMMRVMYPIPDSLPSGRKNEMIMLCIKKNVAIKKLIVAKQIYVKTNSQRHTLTFWQNAHCRTPVSGDLYQSRLNYVLGGRWNIHPTLLLRKVLRTKNTTGARSIFLGQRELLVALFFTRIRHLFYSSGSLVKC